MELYSAWYCPFAQRASIALAELGVEYDLVEIDPYNKTPSWMEISKGFGTVPVLTEGELYIPDSLRVMDYLEDRFGGGRSIFGDDIEQRASARFWIDFLGARVIPYFYRFLKAPLGSEAGAVARDEMEKNLARFGGSMHPVGPFFQGNRLGAVDIAFLPFAYRISLLLDFYRDYQLPQDGHWERYGRWREAGTQHAAFLATKLSVSDYDDALIGFYARYASGGGQSDVTRVG